MNEKMKRTGWAAGALVLGLAVASRAGTQTQTAGRSSVEVVFVLDTTGSMGGLLEGAKKKIWSIAKEIAKAEPAPEVKMGLIAYRDKGDAYVTRVVDLTRDLDAVYGELLKLQPGGGGDGPEHVLKALEDAENRISWEDDEKTFRVVYLVGDAPPHHDYGDTADLKTLSERLVKKGVVLNTIQCGNDAGTTLQWRRIASLGAGSFLPIPHDGGVVAMATPYDDEIAALNARLERSMVGYGAGKNEVRRMKARSSRLSAASAPSAAADRAEYKAKEDFSAELDLVKGVEEGRVDLATLPEAELPDEFKGLAPAERKVKAGKIASERETIRKDIAELAKKRGSYLKDKSEGSDGDSFDRKLVESLKEQARKKGILY